MATAPERAQQQRQRQVDALEGKIKNRKTLLKEHDDRLSYLQSNGFQLGNFYVVFQGVILTAIASGDSVFRCLDRSLLISVSALATLPNLVAFYLIGEEYIKIITQRDDILILCDTDNQALANLRREEPQQVTSGEHVGNFRRYMRIICFVICMACFLGVFVVVVLVCMKTLRKPGSKCKY
ncbi:hypothetical protein Pyn_39656 [Prunus yedoensis var. nudiflora]|uniref:Uncharacterized protein n=1 Tax=Prunus yedoensis var. nudiflora TaxID=2094558 RepID=A0A314YEB2_PRUYE|nr:hypothetical protein Pyn_39656 [Prunus yedoensis var. nudiflora]